MNVDKKAKKLCNQSSKKLTSRDIEALAINLDIGKAYGLDANYVDAGDYFQITRYGQEVVECSDIIELIDATWAIAHFIDIGEQHQKVA